MKNSEQPPVSEALVSWLKKSFQPVLDTRGVDLREIDYKSGQYSVVLHLEAIHKRQEGHGQGSTLRTE